MEIFTVRNLFSMLCKDLVIPAQILVLSQNPMKALLENLKMGFEGCMVY